MSTEILRCYIEEWDELPSDSIRKMNWLTEGSSREKITTVVQSFKLEPIVARRVQMALYVNEFPEEMLALEYNDHDKVLYESVESGIDTLRELLGGSGSSGEEEVAGVLEKLSESFHVWRESKSALSDAKKALLCLHMEKRNGADNEDKARHVISLALKSGFMTEEDGWKIYHEGIDGVTTGTED